MKKSFLALLVIVLAGFAATVILMRQRPSRTVEPVAVEPVAGNESAARAVDEVTSQSSAGELIDTVVTPTPPATPPPTPPAIQPSEVVTLSPSLQMIVSRQASYAQKQAAWQQLRDTHRLDEAITELDAAAKADPKTAEYRAALGIAYVQKLRTLEDFREQSLMAIKANQAFDQALELDPRNWDARFWKASSLSYWPEGLNKSPEVIDQFVTLVEQQEKQSPQPQFADTYVLLGEQYTKAGYADYAREVWQRGASMFPGNNALRERLAGAP